MRVLIVVRWFLMFNNFLRFIITIKFFFNFDYVSFSFFFLQLSLRKEMRSLNFLLFSFFYLLIHNWLLMRLLFWSFWSFCAFLFFLFSISSLFFLSFLYVLSFLCILFLFLIMRSFHFLSMLVLFRRMMDRLLLV